MVLFIGNPTNVVICEGFLINNAAFTAYTILPFLACSLFCFIVLLLQFRKEKYIPRRLNVQGDLDVRSVLLDPKGAWVGGIILGTCLIVIIVVSFVHVDVWKISLPFAGAKLVFDFVWDSYRYSRGMLGHQAGQKRSAEVTTQVLPGSEGKKEDDVRVVQAGDVESMQMTHIKRQISGQGATLGEITTHENSHNAIEEALAQHTSAFPTRVNTIESTTETYVAPHTLQHSTHKNASIKSVPISLLSHFHTLKCNLAKKQSRFAARFPTFSTALPRLPIALVPFAFSQFILIEALANQGWIDIFSVWLIRATRGGGMYETVWVIGVLGVILCNIAGTNIGATILLTKIVRAASLSLSSPSSPHYASGVDTKAMERAAAVSLAVASNIGAVSFTFSASLAGLLWRGILEQKGIFVKQRTFARWNAAPLAVMTAVGMGIVCAEMAVLYRSG